MDILQEQLNALFEPGGVAVIGAMKEGGGQGLECDRQHAPFRLLRQNLSHQPLEWPVARFAGLSHSERGE